MCKTSSNCVKTPKGQHLQTPIPQMTMIMYAKKRQHSLLLEERRHSNTPETYFGGTAHLSGYEGVKCACYLQVMLRA